MRGEAHLTLAKRHVAGRHLLRVERLERLPQAVSHHPRLLLLLLQLLLLLLLLMVKHIEAAACAKPESCE